MPFVSPHSALFGKQFQGARCSSLISLGGVHLFILRTLSYSSLLRLRSIEVAKKGRKSCRKGKAAVAKATTWLGRQEARLARGQASCKPKGHSRHLSHMAHILAPCAATRNSLLLRGGAGSQPWHVECLGSRHEPQTRIWISEGRLTDKQLFTVFPGMQE